MLCLVKRVAISALLLIVMPMVILLSGWTWQPDGSNLFLYFCYWITETASYPWAGITCVVLAFSFLALLKPPFKKSILLLIILAVAVLGGQAVKSAIKESVEQPRPFVMWLEQEYHIDDLYFYDLPRQQRAELVHQELLNDNRVPEWLKGHWQNETGYAFPSGHTLFATLWALMAVVLLWPGGHYYTIAFLMGWAILVSGSRLLLGMHWPSDLILATVLSSLISLIVGWVCMRNGLLQVSQISPQKRSTPDN